MEPLVIVTRNNYVESIHHGIVCITDAMGKILYNVGNPDTEIFFRSAAKPFQAIPLIASGAADHYRISLQEIAVACASHTGSKEHQETVRILLERLGLHEHALHCGIMWPLDKEEKQNLSLNQKMPSELHCGCSGKHAAMLALAKYRNHSLENYEEVDHPVQKEIMSMISEFSGEAVNSSRMGIDGCGAPIYLLPIKKIALSYARLSIFSRDTNSLLHKSCKTIWNAMTGYPEMVAGHDRFCTHLMKVTNDRIVAKIGSEGVYCLALKDGNIGVCIKIADGNERATAPAIMQLLKELDFISKQEFMKLEQWHAPLLKNNSGHPIGRILPIFSLKNKIDYSIRLGDYIVSN